MLIINLFLLLLAFSLFSVSQCVLVAHYSNIKKGLSLALIDIAAILIVQI